MRKFFCLVICICIFLCNFAVCANEPPHSFTWNIKDGILTVSGTGEIPDYRNETDIPWFSKKSEIEKIVVKDGITRIGNLAFYGLANVKEAIIAQSVTSMGICPFGYTETTKKSIGDLSAPYQFEITSDSTVISKGDEFTVSIELTGDMKDVAGVQSVLLFDRERIAIDENNWYDEKWYEGIDDTNLGYIGKPSAGFVANNLRLLYISLNGKSIDKDCPLYTQGTTTVTALKVRCKALTDIEDINTSCFAIKSSSVSLIKDGGIVNPQCAETQLATRIRVPLENLIINGKEISDNYGQGESNPQKYDVLTVIADGKTVEYDAKPYVDENGVAMVPLRFTLETMGALVIWDNSTSTVFSIYNDETSAVQVGNNRVFTSNYSEALAVPVCISEGRTMVPVDFFNKVFGFSAKYNADLNLITISK